MGGSRDDRKKASQVFSENEYVFSRKVSFIEAYPQLDEARVEVGMILSILFDTFFSNFFIAPIITYNITSQCENSDFVLVDNGAKRSEYHYLPVRRPAATSYAAIAFNPS